MRVRYRICARVTFWLPLVCAARTLRQFPLVLEQVLEEIVTPFCRCAGPRNFEAAGDRVTGDARGVGTCPAETLLLDRRAFGLRSHVLFGRSGSVGLAEGMTARDQSDGLFVVHCHPSKSFPDIFRCLDRIGNAFGAFRVDINQTHMGRAKRVGEITFTRKAFIAPHPGCFNSPVDVEVRFPNVRTSAGETESLKAHGFQRYVSREDHQVGPRDLLAVFLLNWPQQAPCSIEVDVVWPAIEWSETLLASAAASTTVTRAVRTCTVPRHANK